MELVTFFTVSNDAQPIMLIFLHIFFGEKLQMPFGERHFRSYSNLAFASFSGYNPSVEITSFVIYSDSLLQKLLKIGSIRDSIFYSVRAVKCKLQKLILSFCPHLWHKYPSPGAMMATEATEKR